MRGDWASKALPLRVRQFSPIKIDLLSPSSLFSTIPGKASVFVFVLFLSLVELSSRATGRFELSPRGSGSSQTDTCCDAAR